MANLLLPSRNTKQPQHSVQIDWGNPVTNGLLAVDLPGLGYGVVNQNQATGNAPVVAGPVGQQYSLTASSSQYSSIPVARNLTDGATHLLVFIPNLSSGNNYQRGSTLSGPTHHRSFLQLFDGGGGAYSSIQLGGCLGSEYNNSYANFSANTQSGVNILLGYWGQNGATAGIVHNGKLSTGALNNTGTPFGTSASLDSGRLLYVGSPYYGDFTGIALNAVWDRALSTPELLTLNDNPWQIFIPQKRVIYFDVGAGGGDVSGTLSATETGVDTFAASGDVVIEGTLSATETGVDTFAASGDVVIEGALSATETGVDTFAASGADTSTGALSATETGVDTFAASGDVVIEGALSATETGVDTFAASGDVVVEGTLSVSETGTDTFFAAGGNVSTGALAATETGDDTFAASGSVLVEGALAATEDADSFSASGNVIIGGVLAVSETGSDTFSASGGAVVSGTLSVSETGIDTFAASGTQLSTGTLAVTESLDTFSASGTSIVTGVLAATESADTFSATGNVIIEGALSVSETGSDSFLAYDPGTAPQSAIADTQWSIVVKQYDFRIIAKEYDFRIIAKAHRKDILIK